ncbi:MAG: L-histidine N(alpha)-methyltransferase, partial [Bacteroidota bacterium]
RFAVNDNSSFDLIELGAWDCYKSVHLMKELMRLNAGFNYIPIDISAAVLDQLEKKLPVKLPGLKVEFMQGEYFEMLAAANNYSRNRKVILCLGGNIGNMCIPEAHSFCQSLREYLNPGDLVIAGFDLVKNPRIIRTAYDDQEGITAKFNFNLLHRINRELGANFNVNEFEHYCSYEPETGACKSFLVCLADTTVWIGDVKLSFTKNEYIWMEISQKYRMEQIDDMARVNGFRPVVNLTDKRKWFVDACWQAI